MAEIVHLDMKALFAGKESLHILDAKHRNAKQMTGIVSCANTYHLFCVSEVCIEDMEALFSCKEGFHIRVNNLRHVVILFDVLLENSFIQSRWQSVLDKGQFLQSKDGTRFITASSLSSALSAVRNNKTSVICGIKRAIKELKI